MNSSPTFIDLYAGAGGLSEGFVQQGFTPVAHVEMNKEACDTLRTRTAYHFLHEQQSRLYYEYLKEKVTREELLNQLPEELKACVIHDAINSESKDRIFKQIDELREGKEIDVIIGGPPCQAYSLVGRSRDPHGMSKDKRNYLFRDYALFLKRFQPRFFVFENVLGLLTAGNAKYFTEMKQLFQEVGYNISWKVLKAEDYGVLQKRRRVIIIGHRGDKPFDFPEIATLPNSWEVLRDLFSDLPVLAPGQAMHIAPYKSCGSDYLTETGIRNGWDFVTQHIARPHNQQDLEIYAIAIRKWLEEGRRLKYPDIPERLQSHKNKNAFQDRFKVVNPEGYAHTMVAHIAKDGHYYIYPDLQQVRSLSLREAARIQSFPDNYFFEGGRTAAFTQIGNAVPPLMAKSIAQTLKSLF